jgi:serine/threonine protein kinase
VASDFKPGGKLLTSKSGTLAYLAPEVYAGVGYMCEVDWWSLGVTFYECIYSKVSCPSPRKKSWRGKRLMSECWNFSDLSKVEVRMRSAKRL